MSDATTNDATTAGGAGENERMTQIRERAEMATPGPWRALPTHNAGDAPYVEGERWGRICDASPTIRGTSLPEDFANMRFIAQAREDVPWLLSEVDALARRLAAAEGANAKLRDELLYVLHILSQDTPRDRTRKWAFERRATLAADATPANPAIADRAATLNLEAIRNLIGRERDKHKPGPTTKTATKAEEQS